MSNHRLRATGLVTAGVLAGTLPEADKASVLKAYDAGVLGHHGSA